jgi:hypothetical protein
MQPRYLLRIILYAQVVAGVAHKLADVLFYPLF